MTTINTSDDLIRVTRENPEFRETMRRELLTAELLEAPSRLTNMEQSIAALLEHAAETNRRLDQVDSRLDQVDQRLAQMDRRLDQMDSRLDRVDQRLAQMDRRLDQVDQQIAQMDRRLDRVDQRLAQMDRRLDQVDQQIAQMDRRLDGMEGDIKIVKRDIDGLGQSFRREVRAQSSFRGNYAESAAGKDLIEVSGLFADLRGVKRIVTGRVGRARLTTWLRENRDEVEALGLRPRAWRTFLYPDIITWVKDLFADDDAEPEFYIAIEASYTVGAEDIIRATDHAKILRAVTGLDAYPVVAAVMLHDELAPEMESRLYYDVERFTEADDMDAALFYRLDSADLRPYEPR